MDDVLVVLRTFVDWQEGRDSAEDFNFQPACLLVCSYTYVRLLLLRSMLLLFFSSRPLEKIGSSYTEEEEEGRNLQEDESLLLFCVCNEAQTYAMGWKDTPGTLAITWSPKNPPTDRQAPLSFTLSCNTTCPYSHFQESKCNNSPHIL